MSPTLMQAATSYLARIETEIGNEHFANIPHGSFSGLLCELRGYLNKKGALLDAQDLLESYKYVTTQLSSPKNSTWVDGEWFTVCYGTFFNTVVALFPEGRNQLRSLTTNEFYFKEQAQVIYRFIEACEKSAPLLPNQFVVDLNSEDSIMRVLPNIDALFSDALLVQAIRSLNVDNFLIMSFGIYENDNFVSHDSTDYNAWPGSSGYLLPDYSCRQFYRAACQFEASRNKLLTTIQKMTDFQNQFDTVVYVFDPDDEFNQSLDFKSLSGVPALAEILQLETKHYELLLNHLDSPSPDSECTWEEAQFVQNIIEYHPLNDDTFNLKLALYARLRGTGPNECFCEYYLNEKFEHELLDRNFDDVARKLKYFYYMCYMNREIDLKYSYKGFIEDLKEYWFLDETYYGIFKNCPDQKEKFIQALEQCAEPDLSRSNKPKLQLVVTDSHNTVSAQRLKMKGVFSDERVTHMYFYPDSDKLMTLDYDLTIWSLSDGLPEFHSCYSAEQFFDDEYISGFIIDDKCNLIFLWGEKEAHLYSWDGLIKDHIRSWALSIIDAKISPRGDYIGVLLDSASCEGGSEHNLRFINLESKKVIKIDGMKEAHVKVAESQVTFDINEVDNLREDKFYFFVEFSFDYTGDRLMVKPDVLMFETRTIAIDMTTLKPEIGELKKVPNYSPDGQYFIMSKVSGTELFQRADAQLISTINTPDGSRVTTSVFTPDSRHLIIGTDSGEVILYDIDTLSVIERVRLHEDTSVEPGKPEEVVAIAVHPSLPLLVSSGDDERTCLSEIDLS